MTDPADAPRDDLLARFPLPWRLDAYEMVDAADTLVCTGWLGTEDIAHFIITAVNEQGRRQQIFDETCSLVLADLEAIDDATYECTLCGAGHDEDHRAGCRIVSAKTTLKEHAASVGLANELIDAIAALAAERERVAGVAERIETLAKEIDATCTCSPDPFRYACECGAARYRDDLRALADELSPSAEPKEASDA